MTECLNACHKRSSWTPCNAFYSAGIQAFSPFCWSGLANRMPAGACLRIPQACLQACLKHACRPQACLHAAGRGRAGRVPRGWAVKSSLRELEALAQTSPFRQHLSREGELVFLHLPASRGDRKSCRCCAFRRSSRCLQRGKWRTTLVNIFFPAWRSRGPPSMLARGRVFLLCQH